MRTPCGSGAATISAFLDKLQFRPKNVEQAPFVLCHKGDLFAYPASLCEGSIRGAGHHIEWCVASRRARRHSETEERLSSLRQANGNLVQRAKYTIIRLC